MCTLGPVNGGRALHCEAFVRSSPHLESTVIQWLSTWAPSCTSWIPSRLFPLHSESDLRRCRFAYCASLKVFQSLLRRISGSLSPHRRTWIQFRALHFRKDFDKQKCIQRTAIRLMKDPEILTGHVIRNRVSVKLDERTVTGIRFGHRERECARTSWGEDVQD